MYSCLPTECINNLCFVQPISFRLRYKLLLKTLV